ncbi:MAG: hypothetical protein HRT83_07005 [Hyphomicrobiaceae bacterium]|nr:hypothetical protein [Hyphomicrobiaceae bacterium]
MTKPKFEIYIGDADHDPLEAFHVLRVMDIAFGNHLNNDLRPPLGIYNTSLSRLSGRLEKCSSKLEKLFKTSTHIEAVNDNKHLLEEVLDYLELSLYSAAEHVDDLKLIVNGFFDTKKDFNKSPHSKTFIKNLKHHRDFIASVVNAIKHEQARVRLFSQEIKYGFHEMCLHGYFIEGVNNGEVGPNKIIHDDDSAVFSITSIIWEIICFVLKASRDLKEFLILQTGASVKDAPRGGDFFVNAIIAAARLPLYSYDDEHPFSKICLVINTDEKSKKLFSSDLHGSLAAGWGASPEMKFGSTSSSYSGDDVTKKFKLVAPKKLSLQHWT